jgi:hypothetical protein
MRINMSAQTATSQDASAGVAVSGIVQVTNLFINEPGPLPLTRSFLSSGGALLIFASGSLSTSTSGTLLQMGVYLDGDLIANGQVWINVSSHTALIPVLLTVGPRPAGSHEIELRVVSGGTNSDANDYYTVNVIEIGT